MQTLFTFFTLHATLIGRSTVLSVPFQLVFSGLFLELKQETTKKGNFVKKKPPPAMMPLRNKLVCFFTIKSFRPEKYLNERFEHSSSCFNLTLQVDSLPYPRNLS